MTIEYPAPIELDGAGVKVWVYYHTKCGEVFYVYSLWFTEEASKT
jgi:hypothetical protein